MEVPPPQNLRFQLIFVLVASCAFSFAGGYFIYYNHTLPAIVCLASMLLSDIMQNACVASKFCVSRDIQTPVFGTAGGAQYLQRFEKMTYVLAALASSGAVGAANQEYFYLASIFTVFASGLAFLNWRISLISTAMVEVGVGIFGIYLSAYYAAAGSFCCAAAAFGKAFEKRGDVIRTRKVSRLKRYVVQARWSWTDTLIVVNYAGHCLFVVQMFLSK